MHSHGAADCLSRPNDVIHYDEVLKGQESEEFDMSRSIFNYFQLFLIILNYS